MSAETAREALQAIRLERQADERTPRAVLSIFLLTVSGAALWTWQQRNFKWQLLGGLLYLALFHLRYAVLDGRAYSFAAVDSQMGMILYVAVTAAIALLVAWMLVAWRTQLLQETPGQAVETSLGLSLVTVWLLGLFVFVHFTWNGPRLTWMLPEFGTYFLGLLSLIQWIIVPVTGLLLSGLAYFGAKSRRPVVSTELVVS